MVRRGLEKLSLALVRCPLPSPGTWRPPCQSGPHRRDPLPGPIPRALPALAITSPHPPHLTAKSTPHTPAGGSAAGQAPGLPVPRPSYHCCFCSPSTDSPCWPGCGGLAPTGWPRGHSERKEAACRVTWPLGQPGPADNDLQDTVVRPDTFQHWYSRIHPIKYLASLPSLPSHDTSLPTPFCAWLG